MPIRRYQPGDEHAQARIYNLAAGSLPGFKPASADEISRRYDGGDSDPESRYYAIEKGEVVGYATFGSTGRVSYPWCHSGAEAVQGPLLDAVLAAMEKRGLPEAWAAYRADWSFVLDFLRQHDFIDKCQMINYVADAVRLPQGAALPQDRVIEPLKRDELPGLIALAPGLFSGIDRQALETFYWDNAFCDLSESLSVLKRVPGGEIVGASLLVVDSRFADPTKIDAAMPCFRLGAFGTERQRHKRINGLFCCIFADEAEGERLLSALGSQAKRSGLSHIAAQAPSDAPALCAWYDRFFQRQGSFPILLRRLTS
jgi:hypothetical protein